MMSIELIITRNSNMTIGKITSSSLIKVHSRAVNLSNNAFSFVQGCRCSPSLMIHYGNQQKARSFHSTITTQLSRNHQIKNAAPVHEFLNLHLLSKNQLANLNNRGILLVEGVDSVKFLQGACTNQMSKVERGGDGIYAGFLSAQGRLLCDAFIYPINKGNEFPHPLFLIECDTAILDPLHSHLKKFILRNRVKIRNVSDQYQVIQVWGPITKEWCESIPRSSTSSNLVSSLNLPVGTLVSAEQRVSDMSLKDPRHPSLGYRMILPVEKANSGQYGQWISSSTITNNSSSRNDSKGSSNSLFEKVDPKIYTLNRIALGIPEGHLDIFYGNSLPLESNFDYMNGVDFRKGCYLGQELTIRTYHTGVIRKRILPIQIFSSFEEAMQSSDFKIDLSNTSFSFPDSQSDIKLVQEHDSVSSSDAGSSNTTASRRAIVPGKFCQGVANIGLGILRLEHATVAAKGSKQAGSVLQLSNGLFARAFVPGWWPSQ